MFTPQQSQDIALKLLRAVSAADVKKVLKEPGYDYYFDDPQYWRPYGDREKNWDTIGNQQGNAAGALTELITNGIDAVLLRKAEESGIKNMRSAAAPSSMFEAVQRFFPTVIGGKIANLSSTQRTQLATQSICIGVRRADRREANPTYTIIDYGIGQNPQNFPKTFLSLGEKNKEGIAFVQGKFNMGSTGCLRFCTKSDMALGHYKMIISKRPDAQFWGWTLVRIRPPREGEALPVGEYFAPGGAISKFSAEVLQAFGDEEIGVMRDGSIIKLYEYDIGPGHAVDFGLYNALTVNLVDCALPIAIYDFDAKPNENKGGLRAKGIAARTFGGMNTVLREELAEGTAAGAEVAEVKYVEWIQLIKEINDEDLGRIRIIATALKKLHEFLEKQPARIFYTVNGQTQARERASFLNQPTVGLGDLRNNVLINVECEGMDKGKLATVFMPDRERMVDGRDGERLRSLVKSALKEDARLRQFAAEIRKRRANEAVRDDESNADFLTELVKFDPALKDLLGAGVYVPDTGLGAGDEKMWEGRKFPTFLKPLNLRFEHGHFIKEVPLKGYRRIECGTDAENEYLERINSPGRVWSSTDSKSLPFDVKLWNGTTTFTIKAPQSAEVDDELEVEFGFIDHGPNIEPLKFKVLVKFTKEELKLTSPTGEKKTVTPKDAKTLGFPDFQWVSKEQWHQHDFDEYSGAYVSEGETKVIYINNDNEYLRMFRIKEKDEGERILNEHLFKFGLGLLTLSIHKKAVTSNPDSADELVRTASSAMSAHVITLIRRLGGTQKNRT